MKLTALNLNMNDVIVERKTHCDVFCYDNFKEITLQTSSWHAVREHGWLWIIMVTGMHLPVAGECCTENHQWGGLLGSDWNLTERRSLNHESVYCAWTKREWQLTWALRSTLAAGSQACSPTPTNCPTTAAHLHANTQVEDNLLNTHELVTSHLAGRTPATGAVWASGRRRTVEATSAPPTWARAWRHATWELWADETWGHLPSIRHACKTWMFRHDASNAAVVRPMPVWWSLSRSFMKMSRISDMRFVKHQNASASACPKREHREWAKG